MTKKHTQPREPATEPEYVHQRVTDEQIADALRATYGAVTSAARLLGVTSRALYYRFEQSPELRSVRIEAREALVDLAQLRLVERMNEGSDAAIIFCLKTQGRDRGWEEHPQYEAPAINVNVELNQAFEDLFRDRRFRAAARASESHRQSIRLSNGGDGSEPASRSLEGREAPAGDR